MNWDALDYAVAIGLIVAVGVAYKLATRAATNTPYKFGVGIALAASLILIWINAAVGIIGSENDDTNLLYFGVIAVAVVGALVSRFKPRGMALALIATAIAQVAVAVIALATSAGVGGPAWPWDVLVITVFFAALWLGSAFLFRKAAAVGTPLAGNVSSLT